MNILRFYCLLVSVTDRKSCTCVRTREPTELTTTVPTMDEAVCPPCKKQKPAVTHLPWCDGFFRCTICPDALGTDGAALSLDAFLTALVDSAMASHDQDGNGTIEASEFAAFASSNSFLSLWFGHLTEVNTGKTTWRDADVA